MLQEEEDSIYFSLTSGAANLFYYLHREPYATIEKIGDYLLEYDKQVMIFHYGGHADSEKLFLGDKAAHAEGIAKMLRQHDELKLVFLNGCSTKAQVNFLLELGIPAIIATSTPVVDHRARDFATHFYKALAKGQNLKEAFEFAAAFLEASSSRKASIFRSVGLEPAPGEDELEWGLYIQDDAILDWVLPQISRQQIVIRNAGEADFSKKIPINEELTNKLFEALLPFSDELNFLRAAAANRRVDMRLVRRAIMDALPAPVGEHIRKLFAADPDTLDQAMITLSYERLEQIIITYNTLVELMAFTLLSQLWETKMRVKELPLPKEFKDELAAFFKAELKELPTYNYIGLVRQARLIFDQNQITYFVEELGELKRLFFEDEQFAFAHYFFERMKSEIAGQDNPILANEIEHLCIESEKHLAYLMKSWCFFANYKFTTIKGINVIKPRHKGPSFRHSKVTLDTVTAGYLDDLGFYPDFTDDKSVIMLKDIDNVKEYLSLSPFIIDENALKNVAKSKLYFFASYDLKRDTCYYKFPFNKTDILEISSQKYPEVKEQLEAFAYDMFNKPLRRL